MIRRRTTQAKSRPPAWTILTECKLNGRNVEQGTELSVRGERGRFRFHEMVTTNVGAWITCYPVGDASCGARSFAPERVKTVHTRKKGR